MRFFWSSTTWMRCSPWPTSSPSWWTARCWKAGCRLKSARVRRSGRRISATARPRQRHERHAAGGGVMSEALREARELHSYYGASHVLHGVDFRIDRGETVSLMGRNGMGKSTLIRSMLGLVKPRHGEVWACGTPMTGAEPYLIARQGIAYVPEGRGIFPNLTVHEKLVMAARAGPDGRNDWTSERVLATFPRLAERLDNGGWRLSGGEQQMLTIGRALMTNH